MSATLLGASNSILFHPAWFFSLRMWLRRVLRLTKKWRARSARSAKRRKSRSTRSTSSDTRALRKCVLSVRFCCFPLHTELPCVSRCLVAIWKSLACSRVCIPSACVKADATGSYSCPLVAGLMLNKDVVDATMPRKIVNPRIVLYVPSCLPWHFLFLTCACSSSACPVWQSGLPARVQEGRESDDRRAAKGRGLSQPDPCGGCLTCLLRSGFRVYSQG